MNNRKMPTEEIDKFVGNKVWSLRIAKGISRSELSQKLKISQQQLGKYENGTNRISIGRLIFIARVLKENVASFYEEIEKTNEDIKIDETAYDPIYTRVLRNFINIKNREYQKGIAAFIRVLSKEEIQEDIRPDEIGYASLYPQVFRGFVKIKNREYQKGIIALIKVLSKKEIQGDI